MNPPVVPKESPKDQEESMVQVHIWLPLDLKRRLKEYADETGRSSSEVVRVGLRRVLGVKD